MKTFLWIFGLAILLSNTGCIWHHDHDDHYREHVRYHEDPYGHRGEWDHHYDRDDYRYGR